MDHITLELGGLQAGQHEGRDIDLDHALQVGSNSSVPDHASAETLTPFFEDITSCCADLAGLSASFRLKLMEMVCKLVGDTMYKEDNHLFHSSRKLKEKKRNAYANMLSPSSKLKVRDSPVSVAELNNWPFELPVEMQDYAVTSDRIEGAPTRPLESMGGYLLFQFCFS